MSPTIGKSWNFGVWLSAVTLALILTVPAGPARSAPDDTDRDMQGFDSTVVRREKARRAVIKGKAYLDDGSLQKARECFNDALKFDENLHEARFCLGLTEYKSEKYKLAIAHFKGVYERYPQFKKLRLELARCYLAGGDCKQAGEWLVKHLAINDPDKESDKLKREIEECTNQRRSR